MPASAEQHFRIKIGAMIAQGFAIDAVRDSLDLKGVSEVWGDPDADDRPAWYVWLNISRGAYGVRLETARFYGDGRASVARAVLSIRYFPSPDEPAFRHFSERERSLIEGPLFDHTHTPTFHGQNRISEHLFHVGSMEFVEDVARGRSCLVYSTLDRMRYCRRPAGAAVDAVTRELPAWDLGYPLFDVFVGLHSFLTRTAPTRLVLSHQPGFEFVESNGGDYNCQDVEDRVFKSLLVVCAPGHGGGSPVADRMCSDLLAPPWTPVLDLRSLCDCADGHSACGHTHGHMFRSLKLGHTRWEIPLAFNEQWWRLALTEPVVNAMPCGCH